MKLNFVLLEAWNGLRRNVSMVVSVILVTLVSLTFVGSAALLQAQIANMAEFGVVLLMFTLGLEFSLGELKYLRRLAFVGGGFQMGLCIALAAAVVFGFGIGHSI